MTMTVPEAEFHLASFELRLRKAKSGTHVLFSDIEKTAFGIMKGALIHAARQARDEAQTPDGPVTFFYRGRWFVCEPNTHFDYAGDTPDIWIHPVEDDGTGDVDEACCLLQSSYAP
jgi:hypothetical protein